MSLIKGAPWPKYTGAADVGAPWPKYTGAADVGTPWPKYTGAADVGAPWPKYTGGCRFWLPMINFRTTLKGIGLCKHMGATDVEDFRNGAMDFEGETR